MQLRPEPVGRSGPEDRSRFVDREDPPVAEHVAEAGQTLARDGGNHLLREELHIRGTVVPIIVGNLVGSQEGWDDGETRARGGLSERAELLPLPFPG